MAVIAEGAAAPPTPPLLVERLSFAWPNGQSALRHCALQIPRPGLWMLVGSNGSGKSTLLRLIAGLLDPRSGSIRTAGRTALVFQNPDHQLLLPSCGSDLLLAIDPRLERHARESRLQEVLRAVGLGGMAARPIHSLSGGQKQRLAIAAALASGAELLLLDEPTALLDPDSQREVLALMRRLCGPGPGQLTALWITHRLEELRSCDAAALMEHGHVGAWEPGERLATRLHRPGADPLQGGKPEG